MKTLVIISTAGSEREGRKIGRKLVESRLAACVNVIPKVRSFFYWGRESSWGARSDPRNQDDANAVSKNN